MPGNREVARTTKASDTAWPKCFARCPVDVCTARTSRRKEGFCPESSAIELPRMLSASSACIAKRWLGFMVQDSGFRI